MTMNYSKLNILNVPYLLDKAVEGVSQGMNYGFWDSTSVNYNYSRDVENPRISHVFYTAQMHTAKMLIDLLSHFLSIKRLRFNWIGLGFI